MRRILELIMVWFMSWSRINVRLILLFVFSHLTRDGWKHVCWNKWHLHTVWSSHLFGLEMVGSFVAVIFSKNLVTLIWYLPSNVNFLGATFIGWLLLCTRCMLLAYSTIPHTSWKRNSWQNFLDCTYVYILVYECFCCWWSGRVFPWKLCNNIYMIVLISKT